MKRLETSPQVVFMNDDSMEVVVVERGMNCTCSLDIHRCAVFISY